MTESRGGEEFERLHALKLPPVMSRAHSGLDSVAFLLLQNTQKKQKHILNIITPQHLLALLTDARQHSFPEKFQLEERTN